jgi:hypothetical protein
MNQMLANRRWPTVLMARTKRAALPDSVAPTYSISGAFEALPSDEPECRYPTAGSLREAIVESFNPGRSKLSSISIRFSALTYW